MSKSDHIVVLTAVVGIGILIGIGAYIAIHGRLPENRPLLMVFVTTSNVSIGLVIGYVAGKVNN